VIHSHCFSAKLYQRGAPIGGYLDKKELNLLLPSSIISLKPNLTAIAI
jgi:hypothetical protein